MNDLVIENNKIEDMIYEIRGIQVMLDSDLAKLYQCVNGTKTINQATKRNFDKFPNDFYFQLTKDEYLNLKSQFGTSSSNKHGGTRKLPYAFTEQGVAMLATVIHTKVATEVSIGIMRAFVKMRHLLMENRDIYKSLNNINNTLIEHDDKLNYLFSKFDKKEQLLLKDKPFTAYKSVLDILNTANTKIVIVDNYADINLLDLIKNVKVSVTLITLDSKRLSDMEIEKYNREYRNLKVVRSNDFHDRFIVIDNKEIYLLGTSINSLGEKITAIIKLEDKNNIKSLLTSIDKIIDNTSKI